MTSYKDLGYDGFLRKELLPPDFVSGTRTDYLEGVNAGQLLTVGRIASQDGSFYIDLETGEISLPEGSVKTGMINYKTSGIKAVVSKSGGSDYVNIQEAIDYVNRQGGGTVFIDEGTYTIEQDINIYSRISLLGSGPGKSIIDFNNTNSKVFLDGNTIDPSGALLISGSDDAIQNVKISNLTFKNSVAGGGSVVIKNTRDAIVENCIFKDNTRDVQLTLCIPGAIKNCKSLNGSSNPIIIDGGVTEIANNYVNNSSSRAFQIDGTGGSSQCYIHGNVIDGADDGIQISGSNVVIIGNTFRDVSSDGVYIGYTAAVPSYVRVEANYIQSSGSSGQGIAIPKGSFLSIVGNEIYGFADGIVCASDNSRIIGNSVNDGGVSSSSGITITSSGDRNIVIGNDLYNSDTPLTDNGTNTTSASNIVA